MAEDGVPLNPKGAVQEVTLSQEIFSMTEIDSLHKLFVRDLIAHVMRRKVGGWTFLGQCAKPVTLTPFSFRIRHAVDYYLDKESIGFDSLFHFVFKKDTNDHRSFSRVVKIAMINMLEKIRTHNEVLRFLCFVAYLTSWVFERGVRAAPYLTLFNMKNILEVYTEQKGLSEKTFYVELGYKAQDMILDDAPNSGFFRILVP